MKITGACEPVTAVPANEKPGTQPPPFRVLPALWSLPLVRFLGVVIGSTGRANLTRLRRKGAAMTGLTIEKAPQSLHGAEIGCWIAEGTSEAPNDGIKACAPGAQAALGSGHTVGAPLRGPSHARLTAYCRQ